MVTKMVTIIIMTLFILSYNHDDGDDGDDDDVDDDDDDVFMIMPINGHDDVDYNDNDN